MDNVSGIAAFRSSFALAPAAGNGEATTNPRPIYDPDPRYTEAARRARIEGAISADLEISADGTVASVSLRNRLFHLGP